MFYFTITLVYRQLISTQIGRVIKGLNSRYTLLDLITCKEKDKHVPVLVSPFDVA